jgi:hypothetical protein
MIFTSATDPNSTTITKYNTNLRGNISSDGKLISKFFQEISRIAGAARTRGNFIGAGALPVYVTCND